MITIHARRFLLIFEGCLTSPQNISMVSDVVCNSQGGAIQDSLTSVPLSNPKPDPNINKGSNSFMQRLSDNSRVIVSRGPGGSVKIAKAPDSAETSLSLCIPSIFFQNCITGFL